MSTRLYRQALGLCALMAISGCATTTMTIPVLQDESETERTLGAYLEQKGVKLVYMDIRPGDVALAIPMGSQGMPDYKVVVDTDRSGGKRGSAVGERVVFLRVYTGVKIPPAQWSQVALVLSEHHRKTWAGTFYINTTDGELEGNWPLNIGKDAPLFPEAVHDAWARISMSWETLYKTLRGNKE